MLVGTEDAGPQPEPVHTRRTRLEVRPRDERREGDVAAVMQACVVEGAGKHVTAARCQGHSGDDDRRERTLAMRVPVDAGVDSDRGRKWLQSKEDGDVPRIIERTPAD